MNQKGEPISVDIQLLVEGDYERDSEFAADIKSRIVQAVVNAASRKEPPTDDAHFRRRGRHVRATLRITEAEEEEEDI